MGNWLTAGGALAIAGAAVAADLAVAAVAAHRYRGSRDPHAFFLAVGFGVLAIQGAVFGVWWPIDRVAQTAAIYARQVGLARSREDCSSSRSPGGIDAAGRRCAPRG